MKEGDSLVTLPTGVGLKKDSSFARFFKRLNVGLLVISLAGAGSHVFKAPDVYRHSTK
jgi:hypothetical protein